MNIKEFEFVSTRQSLIDRKISVRSTVTFDFMWRCEQLDIRPTLPRLIDFLDHWVKEYMSYTMADEDANKPFNEWFPKGYNKAAKAGKDSK